MAKRRKKCPFCGAEVNKENLDRHLLKVHSELDEEDYEKKGLKKPIGTASKKKTQGKGKRDSRKRKPKKKNRVSAVLSIIAVIIIVSLVGAVIYINLNQNGEPSGETTNNGNGGGKPIAIVNTTLGTIKIELDTDMAPVSAGNFIDLANSGFYNGVIFHRVVPDFVVQGGGFTTDGNQKNSSLISWENSGHKNLRYSIAMARSGDPNSESDSGTATSQFFINLVDNPNLDSYSYPYVVFGRVIDGFSVVDAIGALPTGTNNGMSDWPDNPPVINSIVIED